MPSALSGLDTDWHRGSHSSAQERQREDEERCNLAQLSECAYWGRWQSHLASILDESSTARMRMAFTEKRDMFGAMAARLW